MHECITVDFRSPKYSPIHPYRATNFEVVEKIKKCSCYPDGIQPGMKYLSSGTQYAKVKLFTNFIEYMKVIEDETKMEGNKRVLLSKFFDRREIGWNSSVYRKKKGKVVGFYIAGRIYSVEAWPKLAREIFIYYYPSALGEHPILRRLSEEIKCKPDSRLETRGFTVPGINFDEVFLNVLKEY